MRACNNAETVLFYRICEYIDSSPTHTPRPPDTDAPLLFQYAASLVHATSSKCRIDWRHVLTSYDKNNSFTSCQRVGKNMMAEYWHDNLYLLTSEVFIDLALTKCCYSYWLLCIYKVILWRFCLQNDAYKTSLISCICLTPALFYIRHCIRMHCIYALRSSLNGLFLGEFNQ